MGWKSTLRITRREAISAILQAISESHFSDMTDEELCDMMDELRIGDEPGKPYYGHNFIIEDELHDE